MKQWTIAALGSSRIVASMCSRTGVLWPMVASVVALVASASISCAPKDAGRSTTSSPLAGGVSVADEAAVRRTLAAANHAIDAEDYAAYLDFFSDDAVLVFAFGDPVEGRVAAMSALEQSRPFITNKRHVVANLVVEPSAGGLRARSYLLVYERTASLSFVGLAVVEDWFEKRDGKWLITRHVTSIDPATADAIRAMMAGQ